MPSGVTISVALLRKNRVSRTRSPPSGASRSSPAISSRPVASGTDRLHPERVLPGAAVLAEHLLGPLAAVAGPPAQVGLALDRLLEAEDAVGQRLGPRRAAGHVDVDRHELVRGHD